MRLKKFGMSWIKYPLVLAIGAILAMGVMEYLHWNKPGVTVPGIPPRTPYVAPEIPFMSWVDVGSLNTNLTVYKPNKRQTKDIERKLGGKLPPGHLLGVKEIQELCEGGKLVLTLEEGKTTPTVTVYPSHDFIRFKNQDYFSLSVGYSAEYGKYYRAELAKDIVRTGRVYWYAKGGVILYPSGSDEYVEAGGRVYF